MKVGIFNSAHLIVSFGTLMKISKILEIEIVTHRSSGSNGDPSFPICH